MRLCILALGTLIVVCVGCIGPIAKKLEPAPPVHVAPPAALQQRPGPMVDGPGPGVLPMLAAPYGAPAPPFGGPTTQIRFVGQAGMQIGWEVPGGFVENQIISPGRYDFPQGATYRLKFTGIPGGRGGLVLYPTLQVYPAHPTTAGYLANNTVPVEITDEDLDQVEANNFVTKVIYLPDPKFQDLAIAGVETLVSTRLEPGVDPVAEAARRGTVMVVLRIGNIDLETAPPVGPGIVPVSFQVPEGEIVPPMPIAYMGGGFHNVPGGMVMAASGYPGIPTVNPISGANMPHWGQPITGTPIGLPGPPHLPYGGPAGLQSHTVRNLSENRIPKPVDHLLIDVRHEPGYSLPKPVKHIEYTERHPVVQPHQLPPNYGPSPYGEEPYCPPGEAHPHPH